MNSLIKRKVLILIFVLLFMPLLIGCFLLPPQNQDPIIASAPVTDATVGQVYTYNVEAIDPDGDPLTYAIPVAPDGMEISEEGIISWIPVAAGTYEVTVEVSDGKTSITQTFTIVVNEQPSTPSPSPPSAIDIEDVAKNILETQNNGTQYFEQLDSQHDPDALQKTVDFLKIQPNVDDAEIGEDEESIWIKYKSGIEGVIYIEPFRFLGDLSASKLYDFNFVRETMRNTVDKNAIILLPFNNIKYYEDESVDDLRNSLMQCDYSENSIETYIGDEVTTDLMRTLSNYEFIYMATHGGIDKNGNLGIGIGEGVNPSSIIKLWTNLTSAPPEILIASATREIVGVSVPFIFFSLNPGFFPPSTYPGSFVYMNACSSYKNSSLADVFLNNGADVYIGWDNIAFLTLGNLHNPEFFEELARPDNTLQQAYNSTFANYYPATVYKDTNNNKKWRVKLLNGEDLGDWADTTANYNLDLIVGGNDQFVLNPSAVTEICTITASAGPNGSISPSGEIFVNHGSDQSFNIAPDIGYIVEDVMVDGSSVGAVDVYTFTNITQNHTISATFSTIETTVDVTYALTVNNALPLQEGILYERWIDLQWENYPEAIGYNIYRSVNQEEYLLIYQTLETTFPGLSDSDVSIGNSYDYYITAYGANWETAPSEIKHLDTWLPCPYLTSPVDNSTITDPNPTFTWNPVGISNFPYGNIYSGSSAFFVHQHISEDSINICRIDFPDLITSNATYYQDENASPLVPENNYFFNTLAWGFDSSGSLIAKSCSHIWEFYYAGDGEDYLIEFEDPNLEQVVRETINKLSGLLYLSDVIGITTLNAYDREIISLGGIHHLQSLQVLGFRDNQVSDISPLSNLINLQGLSFDNNQVSDISVLSNLTNLSGLYFDNNQVSDISVLSNLTSLQALYFDHNQVSDISPLSNLINLQGLGLGGNQVSDISVLSNLTNLQGLNFYYNQVSDISVLSNLTNLQALYFDHNQVSDISPLSNLINLQELGFDNNQVTDISSLQNLINLFSLYFSYNQLSDISALVSNPGLGSGDQIYMEYNYLDLTDGSQNKQDIETLLSRGVSIDYIPQRTP
jgi:Leucine-rich repeat (LRR) protein